MAEMTTIFVSDSMQLLCCWVLARLAATGHRSVQWRLHCDSAALQLPLPHLCHVNSKFIDYIPSTNSSTSRTWGLRREPHWQELKSHANYMQFTLFWACSSLSHSFCDHTCVFGRWSLVRDIAAPETTFYLGHILFSAVMEP